MIHVLLVDDEPSLVAVLKPVLGAAGHRVTVAIDGVSAVSSVTLDAPDVVLLDLGLPDMDGKNVIAEMRARSEAPIIVISARHQESEKVAALDGGADDYVNKPFQIGELMARIRAAVRRRSTLAATPKIFRIGPLLIDFESRRVHLDGDLVKLTRKEYDLLQTLARNAGSVVTHKRLLAAGWGTENADAQYLRVYVGLLRQKIEEDASDPKLIITEPGIGYRLGGPQ